MCGYYVTRIILIPLLCIEKCWEFSFLPISSTRTNAIYIMYLGLLQTLYFSSTKKKAISKLYNAEDDDFGIWNEIELGSRRKKLFDIRENKARGSIRIMCTQDILWQIWGYCSQKAPYVHQIIFIDHGSWNIAGWYPSPGVTLSREWERPVVLWEFIEYFGIFIVFWVWKGQKRRFLHIQLPIKSHRIQDTGVYRLEQLFCSNTSAMSIIIKKIDFIYKLN